MARRHRTRKMRGRQRRRTRRQRSGGQRSGGQAGGDAPVIADLGEWKSRVGAKIAEMKRQASEQTIATYKFGDLTDAALALPPYSTRRTMELTLQLSRRVDF